MKSLPRISLFKINKIRSMHPVTSTLPKGGGLHLNAGLDFYITTAFATNWCHFRELKMVERFPLNTPKASEIGRDFSFIKSPLK